MAWGLSNVPLPLPVSNFFLRFDTYQFKEETQAKLLIKSEEGYLREQGSEDSDYLDEKISTFSLIEEAKYQYYYKTYFYGRRKLFIFF